MATLQASPNAGDGARAVPKPRHVAAVVAGNALEFYDFLTYAFFAAQIGRSFFPSANATSSLLASLATFGAGFLMRPVGAAVIGRLGDRRGRKPAMLLSFTLMGVAMTGLALTPSFKAIGVLAPVLAIGWRLVQGFALGGEVGPSTAYLMEAAPAHRRGFYVSLQFAGQRAATLAAGLVGLFLSSFFPAASLDVWGWRAAFLLGAVIVPFGVLLRSDLAETLTAQPTTDPAIVGRPQSLFLLTVLAIALLAGGTTVTYVVDYLTTYATSTLHMSPKVGFAAPITTGLAGMAGSIVGGWLSDRFGRKPLILIPWGVLLLVILPGFALVSRERTAATLIGLSLVLSLSLSFYVSAALVSLSEGLPMRIRSGALGLIYAFAISVFGGSTQFTVAWLTHATGSPLAPAWYATGAVAVGLLAALAWPETAPARKRP